MRVAGNFCFSENVENYLREPEEGHCYVIAAPEVPGHNRGEMEDTARMKWELDRQLQATPATTNGNMDWHPQMTFLVGFPSCVPCSSQVIFSGSVHLQAFMVSWRYDQVDLDFLEARGTQYKRCSSPVMSPKGLPESLGLFYRASHSFLQRPVNQSAYCTTTRNLIIAGSLPDAA
jgi:hypothetical protein